MPSKARLASIAATFIPCYIFWLLLTMSLAPAELVNGLIVCGVTAWFSSGFFMRNEQHPFTLFSPKRLLMLVWFMLVVFGWELVKSNWAMAKQVLLRKPIRQAIIKMKVEGITNYYALALLANCITMTPGTITFDLAQEEDGQIYIYVHWLVMETEDPKVAAELIMGKFTKWIRRIWE